MDVLDALILGIIQGLTEFLPVSSSGHLEIGKHFLDNQTISQENLFFTVLLHFATALSTLVVFRKDISQILSSAFQLKWDENIQLISKIILSMIPAVVVGLLWEEELEALFGGSLYLVGFMLIVTALLLFLADKAKNTNKSVSFKDAFIIGISQAVAILPGVSRSGATISTSVLLGDDKSKAARFSFLMVIPLIFGKIAKDILGGELAFSAGDTNYLLVGFISAFVTGLMACTWMIKLVKNSKLIYFSIYCFIVGVLAISYSVFG